MALRYCVSVVRKNEAFLRIVRLRRNENRLYSDKFFDGTIPLEKVVISHGPSSTIGGVNAGEGK